MKKYLKDIIFLTILFIILFFVLLNSNYVSLKIDYSFNLWLTRIVPTVLPTFVIVDLLLSSYLVSIFQKYFHINPILLISIISGSPSNAYMLKGSDSNITKILATTKYTGLVFTFNALKNIFNTRISILLIIINILCNLILYFILKPDYYCNYQKHKNIIDTLLSSIRNCMITLIYILGLIMIFSLIPISMINNSFIKGLLYSLLEVTSSFEYLEYSTLSNSIKLLFSIISLSTCGLCISMQIKSILSDTNYNYKEYIKYRLYHLIMFLVLGLILI